PNATLQQRQLYSGQIYQIFAHHPETDHVFQLDVPGRVIAGMVLKPWDERTTTSNELQPMLQRELNSVPGMRVVAFQPPALPGSPGLPGPSVVGTPEPFQRLDEASQRFMQEAVKSGMFMFLDSDLKIDQPQSTVEIDRDKTAQLGLKMSDVGG